MEDITKAKIKLLTALTTAIKMKPTTSKKKITEMNIKSTRNLRTAIIQKLSSDLNHFDDVIRGVLVNKTKANSHRNIR